MAARDRNDAINFPADKPYSSQGGHPIILALPNGTYRDAAEPGGRSWPKVDQQAPFVTKK